MPTSGVNVNDLVLTVTASVSSPAAAYWYGVRNDGNWSTTSGGTNWVGSQSSTTDLGSTPGVTTDVVEAADNATSLTQTLGGPLTINSLTFSSASNVTIASGDTLKIQAIASAVGGLGYLAGNGIVVKSGAGSSTINADVVLGANQAWTNNSSNLLTVGGSVTGSSGAPTTLTILGSGNITLNGILQDGVGSGNTLALTNSGAGTLVLAGANIFTGALTLQSGTISVATINDAGTAGPLGASGSTLVRTQIGANGQTGTLQYTGSTATTNRIWNIGGTGAVIEVTNPSTNLTFNGSSNLNGSGTLTKTGPGTLTLQFGNTGYTSGAIVLLGGTLAGNGNNAVFGAAGVTLTLNSGTTLDLNDTVNRSFNKSTTVNGSMTILTESSTSGSGLTYTMGPLAVGASTLTVSGGNVTSGTAGLTFGATTLSGATIFNVINPVAGGTTLLSIGALSNGGFTPKLTGNGNFAQTAAASGAGGFTLDSTYSGTATLSQANTYTGGTTLAAGTLNLGSTTAIGATASTLTINGGVLDSSVLNLVNASNNAQIWNADFAFAGTQSLNLGTGGVDLGATGTAATRTIAVMANTLTIGGVISNGTNSATTGLTKVAAGTLVLSGANTYTGATTVSEGTLQLDGSNALGAVVNVTGTGNLLGAGTIRGNLNYTSSDEVSDFEGTISGATTVVTVNNAVAYLYLGGSNTYGGGTNITSGGLVTFTSTGLGTGAVNVSAGGNVWLEADNLTVANNFTLNGTTPGGALISGDLTPGNVSKLTGKITLNATSNIASWWNDKTLMLSGQITGPGGLIFDRDTGETSGWANTDDPVGGRFFITGASNNYAGSTTVNGRALGGQFDYSGQAQLFLGADNALPATSALTLNSADLYLNGFSQTLPSISGSDNFTVQNGSTTPATLILGSGGTTSTFRGIIQDNGISVTDSDQSPATIIGTVALTKIGVGTLVLTTANQHHAGKRRQPDLVRCTSLVRSQCGRQRRWHRDHLRHANQHQPCNVDREQGRHRQHQHRWRRGAVAGQQRHDEFEIVAKPRWCDHQQRRAYQYHYQHRAASCNGTKRGGYANPHDR